VLGLGDPGSAPPGTAVTTRPRSGPRGRGLAALRLPWQARGRVLVCLDPDVLPSAALRRVTGRRVVADVHEDYLALLVDRAWARGLVGLVARVLARVATLLAARADLTAVADGHVPPLAARSRLVVKNLPDTSMLPAPSEPGPTPRALYVGDLRATRGLFTMLEAVEAAPGWELDLVGPVAAADQSRLDDWLASSPAAARVRLHGRLAPRDAWVLAEGAWAGLALLDRTPAFEAAVPTKLYEYLACGLPVVVTPLPRMVEIVEASGAGAVAADASAAAEALRVLEEGGLERQRTAAREWSARQGPAGYDELAAAVRDLVRQAGPRG
jgi:glycosyltransferase involved in cell wall biosynthesis